MRKYILLAFIALIMVTSMCVTPPEHANNFTNSTGNSTEVVQTPDIYVQESMDIQADICSAKGIDGKVLIIHKTGCPACAVAVPRVEALLEEFPDIEAEILDLADSGDVERMKEIGVIPYYVPTIVIDCYAMVGVHSEEEYMPYLERI